MLLLGRCASTTSPPPLASHHAATTHAMNKSSMSQLVNQCTPLWILTGGHVFASLFLKELSLGLGDIEDAGLKAIFRGIDGFYHWADHWIKPLVLVLVIVLQVLLLRGKSVQRGLDFLGAILTLRCIFLFATMNLLLVSQLKANAMLLTQLVLFIPVVTLNFGWLYWRLDSAARQAGRRHIRFEHEEERPDPFDYFYSSAMALLQFEPKGATPLTRLMKVLFVVHGVIMLDLVALTLSRAVALTSGG